MVGMQSWLVSWLTRPSLQTQHQRQRLIQNKRVFEVLFYKTHRILLVSRFFLQKIREPQWECCTFATAFEMHRECGRRLSKGQASLPLRSPCTTLATAFEMQRQYERRSREIDNTRRQSTTPADNRTDRSKASPGPLRADEEIGRSKHSDNPDFGYSGSRVLTNLLSTKLWLLLIKLNCA